MSEPDVTASHARIQVLPTELANQIAAGEVIERPSSIIKELVENSLDAGARQIDIHIEKGGIALIQVRDNGTGIDKADLALALSRHATSKVRHFEDLLGIASMGFRGEALASIASVSQLSLTSRTAKMQSAMQVIAREGAQISDPEPAAGAVGTTVTVRELFYNTPARRKFLKSDRTESSHIEEVVKRIALSRFDVAFKLTSHQKTLLQLPVAGDEAAREKRIAKLCGSGFVDNAYKLDLHAPSLRLWGWISHVDYTRSQADVQYFYVNGRIVRDKVINHAVRQSYRELLHPGRHALFILYLECPVNEVDVNVHPTKHEVRFAQARHIHDFITTSVSQVLAGRVNTTQTQQTRRDAIAQHEQTFNAMPDNRFADRKTSAIRADDTSQTKSDDNTVKQAQEPISQTPSILESFTSQDKAHSEIRTHTHAPTNERMSENNVSLTASSLTASNAQNTLQKSIAHEVATRESTTSSADPSITIEGILGKSLMTARSNDRYLMVDCAQAFMRLLYYKQERQLLIAKPLLIPQLLILSLSQSVLLQHEALLASLGIELRETGPDVVSILKWPADAVSCDPVHVLHRFADKLTNTEDEALLTELTAVIANEMDFSQLPDPNAFLQDLLASQLVTTSGHAAYYRWFDEAELMKTCLG